MRYFKSTKYTGLVWRWDGEVMKVKSLPNKNDWWFSGWQSVELLLGSDQNIVEIDEGSL